jgi:hypothetical protein
MWHLSKPVVALVVMSLAIAISGGAYALASSGTATITVCISHNGGTLYKARSAQSTEPTEISPGRHEEACLTTV